MPRIHLIEPTSHGEVINNLVELMVDDYSLTVYSTRSIGAYIDQKNSKINFKLFKNSFHLNAFLFTNWQLINSCELLIFTTLPNCVRLFALKRFTTKSILIVHNVNSIFDRQNNFVKNRSIAYQFLNLGRYIQRKILLKNHFKKRFISKVNHLSFADQSMYQNIQENGVEISNFILKESLPIYYHRVLQYTEDPEWIRIVIPGIVRSGTKNYAHLFRVLNSLKPLLDRKIKVSLLGKVQDQNIISEIQKLNSSQETIHLEYYEDHVDQERFDKCLQESDFGILPVREKVNIGGIYEYFGKTKISGVVNDFYKFGIPFLIPEFYFKDHSINKLASVYQDEKELLNLLIEWVEKSRYLEKRKHAASFLQSIDKEAQKQKINAILSQIVNEN